MGRKKSYSILRKIKNPKFYENAPMSILKAIVAISENYKRKGLSTGEIARIIGVSECHLCHAIRESFGFTCSEFLQRYRIEMAKPLLKDKELLIKQVASKVGFNSQKHFSKDFKKVEGITPTEFRRRT
jgi:two-component system response regulator YesN